MRLTALAFAALLAACETSGGAQTAAVAPPSHDGLNAVLWTQRSVEFKGNAESVFALARVRLNQALADRRWTAAPAEQTGNYRGLKPAIVLDVDETVLDNSNYQAWNVIKDTSFDPKTWTAFVNSQTSVPIPGAVEFAKYAAARGVTVFYVTNRTAEEEPATRRNLAKFGFPLNDKMDTILTAGERPDWRSAKSTRRAFIAQNHRILLNVGDNFSDFTDDFRGTEAERLKVWEANKARWGREWLVVANPTYGSFESAPYKHDFRQTDAAKRQAKRDALTSWPGP